MPRIHKKQREVHTQALQPQTPTLNWLQKFRVTWQEMHPFKKACAYGFSFYALSLLAQKILTHGFQGGHFNQKHAGLMLDVCVFPVLEEMFFSGCLSELIRSVQIIAHRMRFHHKNPTSEQLDRELVLRVNLKSALFALSHPLKDQLILYSELGRATGYLYEQKGLLPAMACHIGHNLLSVTGPSLIERGASEVVVNHHLLYLYVFLRVVKRPMIPMPGAIRSQCKKILNKASCITYALCEKAHRITARFFRLA